MLLGQSGADYLYGDGIQANLTGDVAGQVYRMYRATLDRVLARLPYGAKTKPIEEFDYEESPDDAQGRPQALDHENYCWMNTAYVLGTRLTEAEPRRGAETSLAGHAAVAPTRPHACAARLSHADRLRYT